MNPGTGGVIQRRARPRPKACTLPVAASESSARCTVRWLVAKRQRQRRAGPRFAIGEEGEHGRMLLFYGRRQHDDLACAARLQRKTSLRRTHLGQRSKHLAKPAGFDPQSRAQRFIGELQAECARDERVSRYVSRPCFAQRACEREQHRTPRERDHLALRAARRDGRRPPRMLSRPAALRLLRASGGALRHCQISRAAGVFRTLSALSTSAVSAGMRAWRAASSARASAARASFVRRRRIAIPASTSSCSGPRRGRQESRSPARRACARPRRCARSEGGVAPAR